LFERIEMLFAAWLTRWVGAVERFAWPVVETHARIAWVAGARVAFWARDEESPGMWVELERRTL
jgi:hypothetical protein